MFEALDSLKPHEIYVATGASPRYALWGELMSTRAQHLKRRAPSSTATSAKPPASSRSTSRPSASAPTTASPSRSAAAASTPATSCSAEEEATRLASEKAATESKVRLAIDGGMSTVEALARFGVM